MASQLNSIIWRWANTHPSETISKTAEEETFQNSFYEATITLIKPYKDTTHKKRKLKANITDEHTHKKIFKDIRKLN